jgi:isopropylmalate/homocitrate/citramalate synthase
VKRNLGPEIFCFSRCIVDDVKRAADCGVSGVVIEIPVSAHMVDQAYRWPLEKAIDLSIKATACAKEQGLYTVFFTIDGTRADMDFLLNLSIGSRGTHGSSHWSIPSAYSPQRRLLTRKVKGGYRNRLSPLPFGLRHGVPARSWQFCGGGGDHSRLEDRRGCQAPMEETAMALLTMYGIDVGINFSKINELSKLVMELSGLEVPPQRPFVGEKAFTVESGIVTGWYRNAYKEHPTRVFPVRPEFVGHAVPDIIMGKKSGVDNIMVWAQKLGLEIAEDEKMEILNRIKRRSHDLKRVLTEREFSEIVAQVRAEK